MQLPRGVTVNCATQRNKLAFLKFSKKHFEVFWKGLEILFSLGDIPTHLHQAPCDPYRSLGRSPLDQKSDVGNLHLCLEVFRMHHYNSLEMKVCFCMCNKDLEFCCVALRKIQPPRGVTVNCATQRNATSLIFL